MARGERIHYLKIGDMFGQQNLAEQSGTFMEEKWQFDLYAETDGIVALLPFGEVKQEMRRQPKAVSFRYPKFSHFFFLQQVYKILEIAADQAYETTHYNLTGASSNPAVKFDHHPKP